MVFLDTDFRPKLNKVRLKHHFSSENGLQKAKNSLKTLTGHVPKMTLQNDLEKVVIFKDFFTITGAPSWSFLCTFRRKMTPNFIKLDQLYTPFFDRFRKTAKIPVFDPKNSVFSLFGTKFVTTFALFCTKYELRSPTYARAGAYIKI